MQNLNKVYHNVDFKLHVDLPNNNSKIISKIKDVLLDLPALNIVMNKKLLAETIEHTKNFCDGKKFFVVFGTGGSSLGAKALINLMQGNENQKIIFYDNIDSISFENSINKIDLNKTGFIIISKSGSTPETLSQFASLIEIFEQKNNLKFFFSNTLVITELKPSPLFNIAQSNGCQILKHEDNIGGRYSIFSNVGLVPAIIAGLDINQLYAGVKDTIYDKDNNDFLKIAQFFRYQKINSLLKNSVIMTYSDALFNFGKWYLQLWAESLGKDNKGITAIHAVGTTDQHSQLQLYLDGPKDKFFTFITTNHMNKGLKLHNKTMEKYGINYLSDKTMGDLMHAEQRATIETFKLNNFPCRVIDIPIINEYFLGRLVALSIMETISTCIYFEVNPFNQPAVEQAKILTKEYLV